MSLKSYSRAKPQVINHPDELIKFEQPTTYKPQQRVTIWSLLSGFTNDFKFLVTTSSIAGLIIPGILVVAGLLVLGQQLAPEIDQQLKQAAGQFDQGTTPLVADSYISERSQYLSDPGAEYFRQLTESALKENVIRDDPISNNYSGTFYLTIPSLDMHRLPIQANVESGVQAAYNSVLKSQLAHFKGTGLPISDVDNNIVVYGHSARPNYQPYRNDPASAFSFIQELGISDEVIIEMEGHEYKFAISNTKIIEPSDTSIINGTPGKKTLTLFTCWPNGNNSNRFVAIAKPVD